MVVVGDGMVVEAVMVIVIVIVMVVAMVMVMAAVMAAVMVAMVMVMAAVMVRAQDSSRQEELVYLMTHTKPSKDIRASPVSSPDSVPTSARDPLVEPGAEAMARV